jgi:hypothetical protein
MNQSGIMDLTGSAPASADVLEASVTLTEPLSRLQLRLPPGDAGRAEAVFQDRSWAAKHYWRAEPGVTIYEFDEALPAGLIALRIPFRAAGPR